MKKEMLPMTGRPSGQYSSENLQTTYQVKKNLFLPFIFLLFLMSSTILSGEEATSVAPAISSNKTYDITKYKFFLPTWDEYMKNRWLWGFIDYAHGTIERTREVKADRVGNRLILKTPFGGLLWGYERSWGSASILPRRNNVFAGSLAKQPFESGSQDLRDYGYVIDTVRVRRWIMNEEEIFPIKPIDLQGYVLFTDSNAAVGQRPLVDFAS